MQCLKGKFPVMNRKGGFLVRNALGNSSYLRPMRAFHDIKLPASVIADLYRDHLVLLSDEISQTTEQPSETPVAEDGQIKHAGANKKKIVVLVNHAGIKEIPDAENTFLLKMLEACKLLLEDVAIVPDSKKEYDSAQLKKAFNPSKMILFGLRAEDIELPLRFPDFKLQSYDDTVYLQVPDLKIFTENTEESKALKGKLWTCLKSLFQLK